MTQKQKIEQLFSELGIHYTERRGGRQAYLSESGEADTSPWDSSLDLKEGLGLMNFVASFYFDADEKFLAHRVWKRE